MWERDYNDNNRYASGYGRNSYNSPSYDRYGNQHRDWAERASDEVRSWFGDDEAERRRTMDDRRENRYENNSYSGINYDRTRTQGSSAYDRNYSGADNYGRLQRSTYGRGNYAVPGLEPGDPNFGRPESEWSSRGSYGSSGYGRGSSNYHPARYNNRYSEERNTRDLADQAGDEVRSWFGDDDAERRRRQDSRSSMGSSYYNDNNGNRGMSWTHNYEDDLDRDWVQRHNRQVGRDYATRDGWDNNRW